MKIEDKRKDHASIPAADILEEIIPIFRPEHFLGIRKIVLLDNDYHGGKPAGARYVPIRNTNKADIEIYFSHLDRLPEVAKRSRMYLTYRMTMILMHEAYHHRIRGQKRLRKPKNRIEESRANRWAGGAVSHVFKKLFPREEYQEEWDVIQEALDHAEQDEPSAQPEHGAHPLDAESTC